MDPTTKLIIDEFARRFDTHEERWERRFADFERTSADRATAVDRRLAALESTTTSSSSNDVSQRLTELELAHAEQESTVAKRLADLESIRVEPVAKDHDARVIALEAIARDVSTWRLELEGVVDDLRLRVQKVPKIYDRTVFDASTHQPGVFSASPTACSASPSTVAPAVYSASPSIMAPATAGLTHSPVIGPGVAPQPRDTGPRILTVPVHILSNGRSGRYKGVSTGWIFSIIYNSSEDGIAPSTSTAH
ncbi:uncharacterized protein [Miscanthus floridulus]|uniref:uncharacterized protein n=1 Tax=Miscanthus floridulus TaxID=154761 RepID=UPI0034581A49